MNSTIPCLFPKELTGHRGIVLGVLSTVLHLYGCGGAHASDSERASGSCEGSCAKVVSAEARSCELLVDTKGAPSVTFSTQVRGSYEQRGTRLAIAFTGRDDRAIDQYPFTINPMSLSAIELKVQSSTCYDRTGHAIPGDTLQLSMK